jgi:hypothetical protein
LGLEVVLGWAKANGNKVRIADIWLLQKRRFLQWFFVARNFSGLAVDIDDLTPMMRAS